MESAMMERFDALEEAVFRLRGTFDVMLTYVGDIHESVNLGKGTRKDIEAAYLDCVSHMETMRTEQAPEKREYLADIVKSTFQKYADALSPAAKHSDFTDAIL